MVRLPGWLGWIRDAEQARRVAILAKTSVFAGLPRRLLGRLAGQLFEKAYAPGEVVFHEGDPGRGLFIVLDGEVEIIHVAAQGEQRVALFGPSTAFGELALLDDLPRSATARATAASRLLILYRTHFDALVDGDRAIAFVVMHNLLRTLAGYVRAATPPAPGRQEIPPAPAPGDGAPRPEGPSAR